MQGSGQSGLEALRCPHTVGGETGGLFPTPCISDVVLYQKSSLLHCTHIHLCRKREAAERMEALKASDMVSAPRRLCGTGQVVQPAGQRLFEG